MNREQKAIIAIASLKNVMGIFLGPFLTAYFIKTTQDSLALLAFYYIITYLVLALGTLIVARIVNNRFRIQMYRIGVITTFIYMLSIVFLQEKIVYYLPLIAILNGTALSTYWYPYNLFVTNKIDNKDRTKFTVTANTVSSIVGVITPVLLGTIITSSNFKLTSIIIAVLSGIIILLSFVLKTEKNYDLPKVTYNDTWDYLISYKATRKALFTEFLIGLTASDGALNILTTVLIFTSFKTDLNLGIITSIATVLKIIYIKFYQHKLKGKYDKRVVLISSLIPALSLLLLLFFKTNTMVVIYNICFTVFAGLISLVSEIRLVNISNSNLVDKDTQIEFLAFKELVLNLGRIASYDLVLVLTVININNSLYILLIILTLLTIYMGYNVSRLNKYEVVKNKD
ncbi:MAG: MFS transporter [Bacilli bacterium]|nr:MFS transporter [Bacilli bacterium]